MPGPPLLEDCELCGALSLEFVLLGGSRDGGEEGGDEAVEGGGGDVLVVGGGGDLGVVFGGGGD